MYRKVLTSRVEYSVSTVLAFVIYCSHSGRHSVHSGNLLRSGYDTICASINSIWNDCVLVRGAKGDEEDTEMRCARGSRKSIRFFGFKYCIIYERVLSFS